MNLNIMDIIEHVSLVCFVIFFCVIQQVEAKASVSSNETPSKSNVSDKPDDFFDDLRKIGFEPYVVILGFIAFIILDILIILMCSKLIKSFKKNLSEQKVTLLEIDSYEKCSIIEEPSNNKVIPILRSYYSISNC
jgi:uncharacterized membrane protein